MKYFLKWYGHLKPAAQVIVGILMMLLVGYVDLRTHPSLNFSVFYFLPLTLVAWHAGRHLGYLMAFLGTGAWFLADLTIIRHYPTPAFALWNTMIRLSTFMILTHLVGLLRDSYVRQKIFMNSIVHDLRSPAAAIELGLQQLGGSLQESVEAPDYHGDQSVLEAVSLSAHRISTLSDDLAELTRLESGRASLVLSRIPVEGLAESALAEVALLAKKGEVRTVMDIHPGAESVRGDYSLTVRVLENLLNNAIRYSPQGGAVTLEIAPGDRETVTFSIIDDGPGLPDGYEEKIFDKPFQVKGAGSRSGLGLVFCKVAVSAQGGRIWVEKGREKGASLSFSLPLA